MIFFVYCLTLLVLKTTDIPQNALYLTDWHTLYKHWKHCTTLLMHCTVLLTFIRFHLHVFLYIFRCYCDFFKYWKLFASSGKLTTKTTYINYTSVNQITKLIKNRIYKTSKQNKGNVKYSCITTSFMYIYLSKAIGF